MLITRGGAAPAGLRGLPAPARGRPGRPHLRDDGLRHPERAGRRRPSRSRPGIECPTVSPLHREGWVAVRAMVPARRRPAADGRALRPRRPRHPGHRHPCLPALTAGAAVPLPHTWRPLGVRLAGVVFGGAAAGRRASFAWFAFDAETRARVHVLPARHARRRSG